MKTFGVILKILIIYLIIIPQTSCEKNIFKSETELNSQSDDSTWVKGMFVQPTCRGSIIIKILDEHNIGRTWTVNWDHNHPVTYENCVVAFIDTSLNWEKIITESLLPGTIFYFDYTHQVLRTPDFFGCLNPPWITITNLSTNFRRRY